MARRARFPQLLLFISWSLAARAQQEGHSQAEVHPPLTTYACDATGACSPSSGSITLDANWRWTHNVGGSTNCYTGDEWDTSLCPDPVTCAANCAIDGADCACRRRGLPDFACLPACQPESACLLTLSSPPRLLYFCRRGDVRHQHGRRRNEHKARRRRAVRHEHWRAHVFDGRRHALRAAEAEEPRAFVCR